jgi:glucan-binding YG repeat protein
LLPQDPYVAVDSTNIVYQSGKYYYYDEADSHYKLDNSDTKTEGRIYYLESELGPAITTDQSSTNLLYKLRVPTNFQLDLDDNNIYYNKEGFNKAKRSYDNTTENSINYKLS